MISWTEDDTPPARPVPAWHLLLLAAALALLGALAQPAQAQVQDSLVITVLGAPDALALTGPTTVTQRDTITVGWQVLDEDGEPAQGVVTWAVRPPEAATLLEQTDSTVTLVVNQKGTLRLVATVARMDRLVIGGRYLQPGGVRWGEVDQVPAGTFQWSTAGAFVVRENTPDALRLCVVGLAGERVLFASTADCYNNLDTLVGAVPPLMDLYAPWWRRADLVPLRQPTGPLPPVQIRPALQQLLLGRVERGE